MLGRRVTLPKCISPSSRRKNPSSGPSEAPVVSDHSESGGLETPNASSTMNPPLMESPLANSTAIKVVVRVRPLSERELMAKSPVVVNVTKASVQVINPALFTDPTFLESISTATTKYSVTNLPVALTAQAITAANQVGECRSFHFDHCFGVDNAATNLSEPFANAYDIDVATQRPNQELVFEEIGKEIIPSTFQGFNCTVFAYGQTGSGKTHTMVGEKSTSRGKGVIPRVCEALFQGIDARRVKENEIAVELEAAAIAAAESGDPSPAPTAGMKKTVFTVQMSYCEIYKEKVHDLLEGSSPALTPTSSFTLSGPISAEGTPPVSPTASASNRGKILKVREHPITGPFVEGLSTRLVSSYEEIADEMLAGDKLRTVAATLMNPVSSRSHAMFTLTLTQTTFDAVTNVPSVKTSKIAMIDLAGSERANVSGTSGDRLKEGAMINKSLTTLGRVISALSKSGTSAERIPYRDSTLTWLLKESLGGNAKTTMIAMVSPAAENYDETMSTLRYAESAKKVMNQAVVNEDPNARVIRQLRDEIQQLKDQLIKRETEAFYLVENLKDKAELPPSVQDRDEFYRELQDEMGSYKARIEALVQKQIDDEEQTKKASRVVRMHTEFPSLLNVKSPTSLDTNDVIVCTLREGVCFVGTEEPSLEKVAVPAVKKEVVDDPNENRSPRRTTRSTSWAGSLLKRRKSSASDPTVLAEKTESLGGAVDGRPASPRKRDAVSDAPTEEPTTFLRLALPESDIDDHESLLPRHAMLIVRSRSVAPPEDTPDAPDEIDYIVELQPYTHDAVVLINGNPIANDARTRVLHGDIITFGHHRFCLHVPHIAAKLKVLAASASVLNESVDAKTPQPALDDFVSEANTICTNWHFEMEFAIATTPLADRNNDIQPTIERVLVKKRLGSKRFSISQWSREELVEKLVLLRQVTAALDPPSEDSTVLDETTEGIPSDNTENPDRKVSTARQADHVDGASESEASLNDESRSTQTRMIPASMSLDGRYSTTLDTTAHPHVTSTVPPLSLPPQSMSVRQLGHIRIYFSGLGLEKDHQTPRDIGLSVAAYDTSGRHIARLHCRLQSLQGDSSLPTAIGNGDAEVSGGSLLKRLLSPRSSQATANRGQNYQSNRVFHARLQLTVESLELLRATNIPEQLSLTLKKWNLVNGGGDDEAIPVNSTPKVTARSIPADEHPTFVFNHTMLVTLLVPLHGTPCDEFVSVEMWGYGEAPSPRFPLQATPPTPHKIELFVSVDIEERDADGFYHPVAVKSDGTLRLHINQPRRVSLRITQADHGPFVLRDFALARLSPAFPTHIASNLVIGDGKSMQSLLLPPAANGITTARGAATTEVDDLPTFQDWHRLFPRSTPELDASSRSLNVSLRWERNTENQTTGETDDGEDFRSVFRFAVAFRTTLSPIPIVISKSVVTKLSTIDITSSQRLAREWETSRTPWWARESYSRSYRLGTWFSIDVAQHTHVSGFDDMDVPPENTIGDPSDESAILQPPTFVTAINGHISCLRRLEICFAIEHVRQEILLKYLMSRISDEYPLTLERAQECFEQILAQSDREDGSPPEPPVIKVLLLNDGGIYLRHKASKELFVSVETGDVGVPPGTDENTGPSNPFVPEHITHFVSEPSSLMGDASSSDGGEMCGFLMFSTSIQLDESAIVSPTSSTMPSSNSSNPLSWARNSLTNRLSWERRWFVLKRPFLYAYKSFARKEQIGVLDVVRCQLVVPSTNGTSSNIRRLSLPGVVSRRGSKPDTPNGGFPFCFQLVSLAGSKCVVWSLQASTQVELRAWLVAIDPLRIEAREAVVTSNAAQADREGAAVLTA